jgi:hypothetical protein
MADLVQRSAEELIGPLELIALDDDSPRELVAHADRLIAVVFVESHRVGDKHLIEQ